MINTIIEKIEQLAAEKKIELIFVLLPNVNELRGKQSLAYNQLESLLKTHSANYIDALSLFKDYDGSEQLFVDERHITYAANKIIARDLVQHIYYR